MSGGLDAEHRSRPAGGDEPNDFDCWKRCLYASDVDSGQHAIFDWVLFTIAFATEFASAPFPTFSAGNVTAASLAVTDEIYLTASTTGISFYNSTAQHIAGGATLVWNIRT